MNLLLKYISQNKLNTFFVIFWILVLSFLIYFSYSFHDRSYKNLIKRDGNVRIVYVFNFHPPVGIKGGDGELKRFISKSELWDYWDLYAADVLNSREGLKYFNHALKEEQHSLSQFPLDLTYSVYKDYNSYQKFVEDKKYFEQKYPFIRFDYTVSEDDKTIRAKFDHNYSISSK